MTAGVSEIVQRGDRLKLTLGAFRPESLASVCGLAKYRRRLSLNAGETPSLTLTLAAGEAVLDAALTLVEDLKLAGNAEEND